MRGRRKGRRGRGERKDRGVERRVRRKRRRELPDSLWVWNDAQQMIMATVTARENTHSHSLNEGWREEEGRGGGKNYDVMKEGGEE